MPRLSSCACVRVAVCAHICVGECVNEFMWLSVVPARCGGSQTAVWFCCQVEHLYELYQLTTAVIVCEK